MGKVVPFLENATGRRPAAAIFLSGGGSNAERLLRHGREAGGAAGYRVAVLVTDNPEGSRARGLAAEFGIPLIENDIRAFYRRHGEARVAIGTPAGRQLREAWTDELRAALQPFAPDFGILAGFVPLTNLTGDFPCLNVHPGDLTYLKDGRRHLVGLHTLPIERAILEGLDALRSSVIIAQPYTGSGDNMDSGPVLGLSEEVPVDLGGLPLERLRELAAARPALRPPGGYGDELEAVARHHQEALKQGGDWVVFPPAVGDFALGRFAHDGHGGLLYRLAGDWHPIETVIYGHTTRELVFREEAAP